MGILLVLGFEVRGYWGVPVWGGVNAGLCEAARFWHGAGMLIEAILLGFLAIGAVLAMKYRHAQPPQAICDNGVVGCQGYLGKGPPCDQCMWDSHI
jgi:hypothetical protein